MGGLSYSDGCLFICELQYEPEFGFRQSLAVYQIGNEDITLLDRLELGSVGRLTLVCPRVERHSRRIFTPCHERGVTVACLDGDRLVRERTLTSVRNVVSMDVMSPDTVYVCDGARVHVVDIRNDRKTSTLEKPYTVRKVQPRSLAVLDDSVLVCCGGTGTLVTYRHGSTTPVRVVPHPGGLQIVTCASTDYQGHFLLTDDDTKSVFVMDVHGNLCHKININTDSATQDCAVVQRQLWVGCKSGDIVIMSSQEAQ